MIRFLLAIAAFLLAIFAYGVWRSQDVPIVRHAAIGFPAWPKDAPPLRAVLLSDIHVSRPDMSLDRLRGIVGQVNALKPDIVLIAGDYLSTKTVAFHNYTPAEALAPLSGLRVRYGVYTVYGNHDYYVRVATVRAALKANGVHILADAVARIGPLTIGGLDDIVTGHGRPKRLFAEMEAERGPKLILSHSPDVFPKTPADITLTLAGHTHCGQVSLPGIGPLMTASDYGTAYDCGIVRERGRTLIVTAGLGTSMLPIRIGAPPDMWLLTLGPEGVREDAR